MSSPVVAPRPTRIFLTKLKGEAQIALEIEKILCARAEDVPKHCPQREMLNPIFKKRFACYHAHKVM